MEGYEQLRAIRAFEREQLRALKTVDDFNVVLEIAYHEDLGRPLNLKQLSLLGLAAPSTLHRRLRRLKRLGVIEQRRSREDRRALEIKLAPKFRKVYVEYRAVILARARGNSRRVRARRISSPGSHVYAKTVRRACEVSGGVAPLAARLRVPVARVQAWLDGDDHPPMELFLDCVDVALTAIEAAKYSKQ